MCIEKHEWLLFGHADCVKVNHEKDKNCMYVKSVPQLENIIIVGRRIV